MSTLTNLIKTTFTLTITVFALHVSASSQIATNINNTNYTKLDIYGNELSDTAAQWSCVRDNNTGLIWEVRQNSGLHSKDATYTWNDSLLFAQKVSQKGFCGSSNWRLPSKDELLSIVDPNNESPKIDTHYFPNTQNGFYWTSSQYEQHQNGAWVVYFSLGSEFAGNKEIIYHARVVTNSQ